MSQISRISLSPLPITHQAVIPESYLDDMGHMNVAWYTHLFGRATVEFYELFDMGLSYMQANQAGAFALEAHVHYLSEVRVGKHVTIHSRAIGRSQKRFHFVHFMLIDEDDRLAATCEFVGAHIDMTVRRMSPFPPEVGARFDRLVAEHGQLDWVPPRCGSMKP